MSNEELIKELREALGPGLKSVVLYGSAAAGDFVEGVSGRDVLIVAERLGASELAALAAPLAHWEAAGNPMPQLFTPEELAGSADVFPIELADMQQSRRVLFGADPLTEIKIDMPHFRIQLERELKTRLLVLRRKLPRLRRQDRRGCRTDDGLRLHLSRPDAGRTAALQ